jgi:hypothetical protein
LAHARFSLAPAASPTTATSRPENLLLKYGNRHGLVTGATGTGKTVTLQILAEGFSNAGVPVFCADIKGDLSGIAAMGEAKDFLLKRAEEIKLEPYEFQEFPVIFWDLFGEQGHPIRATVSEMGPLLLSRLMNLTDAQEGVLNIAFRIADEEGLLLLDLKDLQALLANHAERAGRSAARYGNVTKAVGRRDPALAAGARAAGRRQFLRRAGAEIADLMRTTPDGRGAINVLAADKLMMNPRLYATFLLWLMSELFEELPKSAIRTSRSWSSSSTRRISVRRSAEGAGRRVEQVVRLIRSKGVGVYFVTQNPLDVPETVLAQLGNRIQHALRAYTPREQKAVKTRPTRSGRTRISTAPRPSPSSAPAKRWFQYWKARAFRLWSKERSYDHRRHVLDRSRRGSAKTSWRRARLPAFTTSRLIASRRLRNCRRGPDLPQTRLSATISKRSTGPKSRRSGACPTAPPRRLGGRAGNQ